MATAEEAVRELTMLEYELSRRRSEIQKFTAYYEGKHPLRFASPEYREWFGNQYEGFADNWCAPVADAMSERLKVAGLRPRGETKVNDQLRRWWEETGAASESCLAFSDATVNRRAFALVWGTNDNVPEVTFEHASQAIVSYVGGSRRKRRSGLKLWSDEQWDFATLYLPDEVWKFKKYRLINRESAIFLPDSVRNHTMIGGWEPRSVDETGDDQWPIPNPFGEVPLVELANKPRLLGEPFSEIGGVIAMQDAINALWSYLFTAADFAALPQRVILGAQLPKLPVLDADGKLVGHKPIDLPQANIRRILNLEGPDARVDQWDAARLENFTQVIEKCANHIGNQTRTPLYYFASSIQNISGDTLKALETGLISKVGERQDVSYADPIREVHRLMALAADDSGLAEKVAAGTVLWADHESRSEAQKVDALSKLADMGFPFEYLVEQYVGGDADEVSRIMRMYQRQKAQEPLGVLAGRVAGGDPQDGPVRRPVREAPAAPVES